MILAIESATAACSAALIRGDELIDERHEIVGRGHAERLVPMIAELMAGRRATALLVDCGPGSFTGVRVGLAAAQGLAIGWRVPLSGFSSIALIAAACEEHEFAIALEGGHGELFVQNWTREPLRPLDDFRSLAPDQAAAVARADLVLGSGAEQLVSARGHGEARAAWPRAADTRRLPLPLRSLPPRPLYGRAPDAKPVLSAAADGVEGPMR